MTNDEPRREFETGRAEVPPPSPWDTMADWGRTGEVPRPPEGVRPWASPGPPPGGQKASGLPVWAVVMIVVGVILALCAGAVALAGAAPEDGRPEPVATVPAQQAEEPDPEPRVEVSGTCQNRVIGSYGLVATVNARNATSVTQRGTLWVRWPLTGEDTRSFSRDVTLSPGATADLKVNQEIEAERWFRLGVCDYGWTPAGGVTAPAARALKTVPKRSPVVKATKAATRPVKAGTVPARKSPRTYTLSPVTALRSQATIDRGKLVTWMTSPTCLLAGHDSMGWAWLDNVPTGSILKVTRGPCAGRYRVVGHKWQARKGGPVPSWMSGYDLVLQTCTGSSGMGFSTAQRL